MLDVTSSSAGLGCGAGSGGGRGWPPASVFAAFSTRAIEPVMPSRLCSRVATRVEQPFAVGREHAHGFGQPPAFAGVERPDRLGA